MYAVKRLELPRALRAGPQGHVHRLRDGHPRREPPRHAPDAPVPRRGFDRRSPEGKPEFAVRSQHFTAVDDSLVACRFTSERGFGLFLEEPYARMLRAVTGWDVTTDELERIGERIVNLERLFNAREGTRRRDDVLPWRVMHEPIPDGPSAGMYCPRRSSTPCSTATMPCAAGRRRRPHPRPPRRPGDRVARRVQKATQKPGARPARGNARGDPAARLVGRLAPVVRVAIDGLDLDLLDPPVPQHLQLNLDTGGAARPEPGVERRLALDGLTAHADDDVPGPDCRCFGRPPV